MHGEEYEKHCDEYHKKRRKRLDLTYERVLRHRDNLDKDDWNNIIWALQYYSRL